MPRFTTGSTELDRVLGGGLVDGSVVLIGGDPGIGKSTILLQTLCNLASRVPALYVTGEESQQRWRCARAAPVVAGRQAQVMTETSIETIIATARQEQPRVMVIDSIRPSSPSSCNRRRAASPRSAERRDAGALCQQSGTAIFLVGHVTRKAPWPLRGCSNTWYDTVLYFEGESDGRLRLLRAVKNRFGAVNELGCSA